MVKKCLPQKFYGDNEDLVQEHEVSAAPSQDMQSENDTLSHKK